MVVAAFFAGASHSCARSAGSRGWFVGLSAGAAGAAPVDGRVRCVPGVGEDCVAGVLAVVQGSVGGLDERMCRRAGGGT